ncbi:oxidoreductase [Polynucleobacter paneuropaeus]|nr:oxidoreductase [Polynucleobacter paneuropaeus]
MHNYSVISIVNKTPNTFCLRVERPDCRIKAGQCFNVGLPGGDINREYSMYSDADAPYLDFLIREVEGGLISSQLKKLVPGDTVEIDGPYGEFCIPPAKIDEKFLFIASGTGIAPFHSFVKTYPQLNYHLIHGIRSPSEAYDSNDYIKGRYLPCVSRGDAGESLRVTDYLTRNPPFFDSIIYLCGNRRMIIDSVQILLDQGISGDQIISEVFF